MGRKFKIVGAVEIRATRLLRKGALPTDIAEELNVSVDTVRRWANRQKEKMEQENDAEMFVEAPTPPIAHVMSVVPGDDAEIHALAELLAILAEFPAAAQKRLLLFLTDKLLFSASGSDSARDPAP